MRKELNPNVLVMKKHVITTLLATFSCATTFAQADGNIDFQQGDSSDCVDPRSYTATYSGGSSLTENGSKDVENGYHAELWRETTTGSMTVFGGKADCAFKASWNNSGDFLARVGYFDESSSKKYTDLGEIYAVYNYIKKGDGGGIYSYIGVYGWTKNPMIEYYIVEDSFTPDSEKMYWGTEKKGSYVVDEVVESETPAEEVEEVVEATEENQGESK